MIKIKHLGRPLSENTILWRYFDFQKFLSLLIDESIFFSRMDKMEDINEGISFNQLLMKYGENEEKLVANYNLKNSKRTELPLNRRQRKYFLSCWLVHHRESVAMWNTYSDANGIALKVRAHDLICAIESNTNNISDSDTIKYLYHGQIVYKDFLKSNDRKSLKDNVRIIGFHKDLSFEYEREYRFLLKQDVNSENEDIPFLKMKIDGFDNLKFNMIFHPKMEDWKKRNIIHVINCLGFTNISSKDSELQLRLG